MKALDLLSRYKTVRARSLSLCVPLSIEDQAVQSMPDASPTKWHLAHTTWFFESFVLTAHGQLPFDQKFSYLFNSYYDALGPRADRARRGMMSRPSLPDVHAYRASVDARIAHALVESGLDEAGQRVVELGLHHEQQHQELLLTDIKHALGTQPLKPPYRDDLDRSTLGEVVPFRWVAFDGGLVETGATDRDFAFDNECPRHRVFVEPFTLATRPVSNAEVLAFIGDRGYDEPRFWLSEGFAAAKRSGWRAPMYWEHADGAWIHYELAGVREIDPSETACHLSYFEADAIARWAGARLPTEDEWEHAAGGRRAREGNWADDDRLHPHAATGDSLRQLFGDVWEWTRSAYAPYPGFRPLAGALGEYNGKFMAGQMVLRGGSCLTPRGHVRASYRNFFPPAARWQMSGVRFANDREAS